MDWAGQNVFLTGHTGFKGGWLALLLDRMGARVHGYALDPPTEPALFDVAQVTKAVASDTRADLADLGALERAIEIAQPRIVMHLAAQPLVRASYVAPLETFRSNVIGTAHLLEAVRRVDCVEAVVVVTTDKVYRSEEWPYPYRESDHLGGADPYSASKAAAEIVTESYRSSFFGHGKHRARVASARAGNVIGGGDWAAERLIPDALRAVDADRRLELRFPHAVRPWQHVLEPLSGYIALAEHLVDRGEEFAGAWNFGPDLRGDATVSKVAGMAIERCGGPGIDTPEQTGLPHETGLLRLDSTLARQRLGWEPRWSLEEAIAKTVDWHAAWRRGEDMHAVTLDQVASYQDPAGGN